MRRIARIPKVTRSRAVRPSCSDRSAGRLRSISSRTDGSRTACVPSIGIQGAPARSSFGVVVSQHDVTSSSDTCMIVCERERALAFSVEQRQPGEATGRTGLAGSLTGRLTTSWSDGDG